MTLPKPFLALGIYILMYHVVLFPGERVGSITLECSAKPHAMSVHRDMMAIQAEDQLHIYQLRYNQDEQ